MSSPTPAPDFFDRRPIMVLLILTVAFYWKLALSRQFTYLETPDLAYEVLPWYQFQARAMHDGVFPLWDPYEWSGQPLIGQMQPGTAFPLNWPLFVAPLENGYLSLAWVHWHFVLMHLLAAIFMYALCRELGSSRFAAIVAGAAFSFGGYMGNMPWPQMLHGAMWIPLIFLFFHRMVERGWGRTALSNAACCGAAIGFSLLSGHHQAPIFTLLALAGLLLYYLWSRPGARVRLCALFGVVAVFSFLVGAFQLLPGWEYGSNAYRWVGASQPIRMEDKVPYLLQYDFGIFPRSFLGALFPKASFNMDPFLGLVCLSFAFFAVTAGWSKPRVRIYAGLALGAMAYSVGHYSLFHGLIYTLAPAVDKARSAGHAIFVFQFAALVLAAQGIDLFLGPQEPGWEKWRSRIVKALVAIGLLCWLLLFWLYLSLKFEINPGDHVMLSSLVAFVLAAVLHGVHRGHVSRSSARVSLVLLLLFELSITSYFFIVHREDPKRALYLKKLHEHPGIVAFLKAQPGPFRFDVARTEDFPANLGDWEGLESTHGYLGLLSERLYDFVSWDWGRTSLLLNTVYVIAREPARPQQREVYAEPGGWKVFRNDDAFPRAWVVHAVRTARDLEQAAALFRAPDFDARRETILLAGAPQVEPCAGESAAQILSYGLHHIRAQSNTACAGLVVFGESGAPGWQARVDGRPAQLYAPFGALRGVAVT